MSGRLRSDTGCGVHFSLSSSKAEHAADNRKNVERYHAQGPISLDGRVSQCTRLKSGRSRCDSGSSGQFDCGMASADRGEIGSLRFPKSALRNRKMRSEKVGRAAHRPRAPPTGQFSNGGHNVRVSIRNCEFRCVGCESHWPPHSPKT